MLMAKMFSSKVRMGEVAMPASRNIALRIARTSHQDITYRINTR
jgi:hypothetical protein